MALLKFNSFRGETPIAGVNRLDAKTAQTAEDCRFEDGVVKPLRAPTTIQASPEGAGTQTIFYYPPNNVWLTWATDVDVQRSMIANDAFNRLYWTGEGAPKFATADMIGSGGGSYPVDSHTLGIPAPTTALTLLLSGTPTSVDALPDSRYYVYTFVDAYGSEGPPSPVSLMIQPQPGNVVEVSGLPGVAPAGDYDITHVRLYRTNTGSSGAIFQFIVTLPVTDLIFSDSVLSEYLGDELVTTDFDMPDPNMYGLLAHPGGYFVAFAGTAIYMSEPGYPYAWPVKYQLGVDYNIIGGAIVGDIVVITTTGTPYVLTGNHPAAASLRRIEDNQACLSKRGIVDLGTAVCYPSPDGLMGFTPQGVKNVTENVFTRGQWLALKPSSFTAVLWEGRYLCSYDTGTITGSFALSPGNPELGVVMYPTTGFSAVHNYLVDDYTYLCIAGNIVAWDAGADTPYTWRSGKMQALKPINFGAAQVRAQTYPYSTATPLRLTVYGDGVKRWSGFVFDDAIFRLPGGYLAAQWEVELVGTAEVYEVLLGETMHDLRSA